MPFVALATLGMLEKIDTWLAGDRDYHAGFELLKAGGASALILDLLGSGPDHFNTSKLLTEIGKLRDKQPAITPETQPEPEAMDLPTPPERDQVEPASVEPSADLARKLAIDAQLRTLWKEMSHLHGQLSVLPEGQQLYQCAAAIQRKDLQRRTLFDHLHYFEVNGTWFDEQLEERTKEKDLTDPAQLEQAINNAKSNKSKAGKQLKRPLPVAERQYHQGRFDEFDRLLKHLRSLRHGKQ